MKFEHTKPSRHETRYKRCKVAFWLLCLAYLAIVVALTYFCKENLIYLALIFLLNVVIVFRVGVLVIRALVFPFSLWIISDGFTGTGSERYARDFAALLEKSYLILRVAPASLPPPPSTAINRTSKTGDPAPSASPPLDDRGPPLA